MTAKRSDLMTINDAEGIMTAKRSDLMTAQPMTNDLPHALCAMLYAHSGMNFAFRFKARYVSGAFTDSLYFKTLSATNSRPELAEL
jgi:hypothetical protein